VSQDFKEDLQRLVSVSAEIALTKLHIAILEQQRARYEEMIAQLESMMGEKKDAEPVL
jgi:hypothetical protein